MKTRSSITFLIIIVIFLLSNCSNGTIYEYKFYSVESSLSPDSLLIDTVEEKSDNEVLLLFRQLNHSIAENEDAQEIQFDSTKSLLQGQKYPMDNNTYLRQYVLYSPRSIASQLVFYSNKHGIVYLRSLEGHTPIRLVRAIDQTGNIYRLNNLNSFIDSLLLPPIEEIPELIDANEDIEDSIILDFQ